MSNSFVTFSFRIEGPHCDLTELRAMIGFRSRKRKAAPVGEVATKKPPVDATVTPTASPTKHPVATFANTVHVDPVIKVRIDAVDETDNQINPIQSRATFFAELNL